MRYFRESLSRDYLSLSVIKKLIKDCKLPNDIILREAWEDHNGLYVETGRKFRLKEGRLEQI